MHRLIEANRDEVAALCRRYGVRRLELFGSGGDERFDPVTSDLDFLVEFEEREREAYADRYFGLAEALERLFGRRVDLVMTSAVTNPYFLREIARSRTLLYAA